MKKTVLVLTMTTLLILSGIQLVIGQEQPKPKKDTVNIDTDAKPTFYYAVEDEENEAGGTRGSTVTIIIIGAVIVAGGAGYYLLRKKK